jgi:hypothetical protein
MQLSDKGKAGLAVAAILASAGLMAYTLGGSGKIGPPYRDDALTSGPEPLMLLSQSSVQKELRLTPKQIQFIDSTVQKQFAGRRRGQGPQAAAQPSPGARGAARMGRKHQDVFVAQLLQPQQVRRLHEITLQQLGGLALGNKQTADDLQLTLAQRREVDTVLEKLAGQIGQGFQQRRGPEGRQQMREARQAAGEKLLALLTTDQESRWHELTGAPFTGEITFGPRGGPPGGRGGGARRGGPGGGPPAGGSRKTSP